MLIVGCEDASDKSAQKWRVSSRRSPGSAPRLNYVASQQEVEDNLRLGRESRSFEVKSPGNISNKHYVARVARAAMAMATSATAARFVSASTTTRWPP